MMPHQCTAFAEGLFGSMHSEFERTPKAASITAGATAATDPAARRVQNVKVHWPYVLTEAAFAAYLVGWALVFASTGLYACAIGAAAFAGCIVGLMYFYGDHADRVCFVIPRRRSPRTPDQAGTTTNMRSHSAAT